MSNTKKRRVRGARPSSDLVRNGVSAPYAAYAVAADGSRLQLDARSIVIDLGNAEVEIDLLHGHPILAGQLGVATKTDGLFVVGHGDAGGVYVRVEPFADGG